MLTLNSECVDAGVHLQEGECRLRREPLLGAGAPKAFHALPAGAVFLLGQKNGRKKAPCYLGRLVIGGKKLITARCQLLSLPIKG